MSERKNCIICEKIIKRGSKLRIHLRRSRLSVTCSRECARAYRRIYSYFYTLHQGEIKLLKRKIKKLEENK